MTPSRPPFITIEGVDGAGKSSHVPGVVAQLQEAGFTVCATREPGGTPLGERLRVEILNGDNQMALSTEVLLAFASRAEHLHKVITPALARGEAVLSDRFTDSSYVFQGAGRGFPAENIRLLEQMVHPDLKPDLTLLFDLPIPEATVRLKKTEKTPDAFESQAAEFHERVRQAYQDRAQADPGRFVIIDSSQGLAAVAQAVRKAVAGFVARWNSESGVEPVAAAADEIEPSGAQAARRPRC